MVKILGMILAAMVAGTVAVFGLGGADVVAPDGDTSAFIAPFDQPAGPVPAQTDPDYDWPEAGHETDPMAEFPATLEGVQTALGPLWTWDGGEWGIFGDRELVIQVTEDMGGVGVAIVENRTGYSDECIRRQVLATSGYYTVDQVFEACPHLDPSGTQW